MATATSECPQCGYVAPNSPLAIQPLSRARIEHLLSTNDCLEEEEERDFRSFINDGAARLARIRDRISNVKALLQTLETTKEELELAVGPGRQILHPMRSLSTELLQKVFYYGAELDVDVIDYLSSAPNSLNLKSPPWVYGRVCRRWKGISQKTPEIWTRVKIKDTGDAHRNLYTSSGYYQTDPLSFMSIYLSRSGTLPLSVYIDSLTNSLSTGPSNINYMYAAISALVTSHAHRWEFLFLGRCTRETRIDPKSLSEHSFPSLKRLCSAENACYARSQMGLSAPQLRSWSTLGDTPQLRAWSTLAHNANVSPAVLLSTPLRSLITEYSSFNTSLSNTLNVVSVLPHLQRLFIKNLTGPNFAVNKKPQNTKLRELFIDRSPVEGIQALLHSISCPSLVHFSVNSQESIVNSFQAFEMSSKFRLRTLEISSQTGILDNQWITDSIEVLTIKEIKDPSLAFLHSIPDSVLNLPSHQRTSKGSSSLITNMDVFPNLRRLELCMHPNSDSHPVDVVEELLTFATSRSGSNLEILLNVNDEARKMFTHHPRIEELRSMLKKLYILVL